MFEKGILLSYLKGDEGGETDAAKGSSWGGLPLKRKGRMNSLTRGRGTNSLRGKRKKSSILKPLPSEGKTSTGFSRRETADERGSYFEERKKSLREEKLPVS